MKTIEIEIDGPACEHLYFRPLQRSIRGRFDMLKHTEPMARIKAADWPTPIPSQRLGLRSDGTGYLIEPLHEDQHEATRERIEQRWKLEPEEQLFEGVDTVTWLFWIWRAVQSGIAQVIKGTLPQHVDGETAQKNWVYTPEPSASERLTKAIEKQNELMAALLEQREATP